MIRSKITDSVTRLLLLTEMTYRVLKVKFRIQCSNLVNKENNGESKIRKIALSMLHSIVNPQQSNIFLNWTESTLSNLSELDLPEIENVKDLILKKFGLDSLNFREKENVDLRKFISRKLLLLRFNDSEIKIKSSSIEEFSTFPENFIFTDYDLLPLEPKIKSSLFLFLFYLYFICFLFLYFIFYFIFILFYFKFLFSFLFFLEWH